MSSVLKWLTSTVLGIIVTGLIGLFLALGALYPEVVIAAAVVVIPVCIISLVHAMLWWS